MTGGRSRLVAAAVLAAVFVAGAVVGAAAYRFLGSGEASASAVRGPERERGEATRAEHGSGEERDGRERGPTSALLEILREDIGISGRQEEEVRAVLDRREERAREVFEGVRERFHRWMDTTVARVTEVLDEDQAAEFERLLEERMEERRREHRGDAGPDSMRGAGDSTGVGAGGGEG